MKQILPVLLMLALAQSGASAEDDDDDPKSAKVRALPRPKPVAAPEKADKAPAEKPIAKPKSPPPVAEAPKPAQPAAEAPKSTPKAVEAPKLAPPAVEAPKPTPKAAAAAAPDAPLSGGRPVRVRLADGSTVVGQVRQEQADALIIDCALGQLAIPRQRISTIAYDAAAALATTQKRAPVQQLDDDLPPRKKP